MKTLKINYIAFYITLFNYCNIYIFCVMCYQPNESYFVRKFIDFLIYEI